MEVTTGECMYCGEIMMIEAPSEISTEEANEAAMQKCTCIGAHKYRCLGRAKDTIRSLNDDEDDDFPPITEEILSFLEELAERIINDQIEGVALEAHGETFKVAMKKGEITIKRKRIIEITK